MARAAPWHGEVVSIHIAPKAEDPMRSVRTVRAIAGRGLEGDRYFRASGTYSDRPGPAREITLIESEAIAAMARDNELAISPGDARRNVVTRGVPLNHLVGQEFLVGRVRLRGIRLCEPCSHLEGLTRRGGRDEPRRTDAARLDPSAPRTQGAGACPADIAPIPLRVHDQRRRESESHARPRNGPPESARREPEAGPRTDRPGDAGARPARMP